MAAKILKIEPSRPRRRGWKNPAVSERMKALNADAEFKARLRKTSSERMKALNADPEFKARQSERMKALNADPEFKARIVAGLRRRFGGDPDELPEYGRAEYELAREEGFSHGDAMEIALDAVAMADLDEVEAA